MALITSPTETIPDLNYEYHTVTIDSIGQDSANTFTSYLQQPIKNVVQVRLLAAHIHSNVSTEHCYVSIDELDSIFNDRSSNVLSGQASMSVLRNSFASLVTDDTGLITLKDNCPIVTQDMVTLVSLDR